MPREHAVTRLSATVVFGCLLALSAGAPAVGGDARCSEESLYCRFAVALLDAVGSFPVAPGGEGGENNICIPVQVCNSCPVSNGRGCPGGGAASDRLLLVAALGGEGGEQ